VPDFRDQDELEYVRKKAQRIVATVYACLGLGCSLVALTLKLTPSVLGSGPPVSDHVAFFLRSSARVICCLSRRGPGCTGIAAARFESTGHTSYRNLNRPIMKKGRLANANRLF